MTKGTQEQDVDVRIIGSLVHYIFAPDSPDRALAVLVHADTRIVSMTITESGYDLDIDHPDIQHDLKHPEKPITVFGYIVHAINARRHANAKPFTVMSCDNVQQNGEVTKKCILKFAQALKDPALVEYIERAVTFPNAMGNIRDRRIMKSL